MIAYFADSVHSARQRSSSSAVVVRFSGSAFAASLPSPPKSQKAGGIWLSELIQAYADEKLATNEWTENTWRQTYRPLLRDYRELLSKSKRIITNKDGIEQDIWDIQASELEEQHIQTYTSAMFKFPKNYGSMKGLEDAKQALNAGLPTQSRENAFKKMHMVKTFLTWSYKRKKLSEQLDILLPTEKKDKKRDKSKDGYQPWTDSETRLCNFAPPISLREIVDEDLSPERTVRKVSRVLRTHFRRVREVVVGPHLSTRRMLVDSVVAADSVREAIADQARRDKSKLQAAQKKAHAMAYEIAADYSHPMVRSLSFMLTPVWNRIYRGVLVHHLEKFKQAAPGFEVVYVPTHRSHMDYLLSSYLLYTHGVVPPHIFAGINLNLPVKAAPGCQPGRLRIASPQTSKR